MFFRAAVVSSLIYLFLVAGRSARDDRPPPAAAVAAVTETRIVDVRRDELGRLAAAGAPMARVVPTMRDGALIGMKLYAIPTGSPLAAIGLENGDTVRAIDDVPMTSPGAALEVVYRLQAAAGDRLDLELVRRGRPVRIVVLLH